MILKHGLSNESAPPPTVILKKVSAVKGLRKKNVVLALPGKYGASSGVLGKLLPSGASLDQVWLGVDTKMRVQSWIEPATSLFGRLDHPLTGCSSTEARAIRNYHTKNH